MLKDTYRPFRDIPARALALMLIICFMISACAQAAGGDTGQERLEPTCTEPGYAMITDPVTGAIKVENLPPLGHDYGEWTDENGVRTHVCGVCGYTENVRVSTVSEADFPKLMLNGSLEGIGKKNRVTLDAEFISPEISFECSAVMTLQGHSTYGYPKYNFTVRFYDDPVTESKHKVRFFDWQKEHKYILKANYTDISLCRNIVGARLWREMTACREDVPDRIEMLPTLGAVDGFPVAAYLNGEFYGLFAMNLHKDDDLYGMEDGERAALVICNHETTDESLFRDKAAFLPDYSSDWEVEYCGTADEAWARESFNELIAFVMESSDAEFRSELEDYLHVESAIDYLIFIYALGLPNSGAKDLVMLNYGDEWIPSAYDMDEAFGLVALEAEYLAPTDFVPEKTDAGWKSGTDSLLWDRLLTMFEPNIRERYAFLRKTVLSGENILKHIDEFTGVIPEAYYDMDLNLYTHRPVPDGDMLAQIRNYVPERLNVLDQILGVDEK